MDIIRLTPDLTDDFVALIGVMTIAFEEAAPSPPDRTHLRRLLARPDFWVLVAREGDTVIGGLTLYLLEQYTAPTPIAYLYDLAVAPDWQRRGIGRALITEARTQCQAAGISGLFVQADNTDTHALAFYRTLDPDEILEVTMFGWKG
ncbi:MAG: GNAT family N-acetyltransferase [Bacteroidia bacterium]|nr:GNAT family N-acetyltransferase [Bacteroidia bacterium]